MGRREGSERVFGGGGRRLCMRKGGRTGIAFHVTLLGDGDGDGNGDTRSQGLRLAEMLLVNSFMKP